MSFIAYACLYNGSQQQNSVVHLNWKPRNYVFQIMFQTVIQTDISNHRVASILKLGDLTDVRTDPNLGLNFTVDNLYSKCTKYQCPLLIIAAINILLSFYLYVVMMGKQIFNVFCQDNILLLFHFF